MNKKKVLVIGEYILDKFVYCKPTGRTAPDKCCPVVLKGETISNPGGAANMEANLRSLFPALDVYFIHQEQKIIKTRYLEEGGQHFVRVDEFDQVEEMLTLDNLKAILSAENLTLNDFELIAISDYGKGFVSEELINQLSENHKVFADTKHILHSLWSSKLFCAKINEKEWNRHNKDSSPCQNLIVTRGKAGAEYEGVLYPGRKVMQNDVSGCGDVFFACLIGLHLEGLTFAQSIPICNMLCSLAAKEIGVNIMKKEDLNIAISLLDCPL